jgi:RNA-binding protein YhbY
MALSSGSDAMQERIQVIQNLLKQKPMTKTEVAKAAGWSSRTVAEYVNILHATARISVVQYRGPHLVYGKYRGKDAQRVNPRDNKKFGSEEEKFAAEQEKAREKARRSVIQPDPLFAWIPRRA